MVFIEFNTTDPKVFSEWGIMDGLFVNNKQIRTGPPPSYDTIYKIIQIQLRNKHIGKNKTHYTKYTKNYTTT